MNATASRPLEKEFHYFLEHLSELVERYDGKVVAIKNGQVIGVYDNELKAVTETSKRETPGTFLVNRVGAGAENYTRWIHSARPV